MKTVILDENLPIALRLLLPGFEVVTVQFMGWAGTKNGELIDLIDGRFDVFLTGDKNLRYQQSVKGRKVAIVELPFTRLRDLEASIESIRETIGKSVVGGYTTVAP